jgi:hypothetical protein
MTVTHLAQTSVRVMREGFGKRDGKEALLFCKKEAKNFL